LFWRGAICGAVLLTFWRRGRRLDLVPARSTSRRSDGKPGTTGQKKYGKQPMTRTSAPKRQLPHHAFDHAIQETCPGLTPIGKAYSEWMAGCGITMK
jgi:hypothetical protein